MRHALTLELGSIVFLSLLGFLQRSLICVNFASNQGYQFCPMQEQRWTLMETESKDVKSAEPALIRERCRSGGDCEARRGFCPRRLCPEYLAIGKLVSGNSSSGTWVGRAGQMGLLKPHQSPPILFLLDSTAFPPPLFWWRLAKC